MMATYFLKGSKSSCHVNVLLDHVQLRTWNFLEFDVAQNMSKRNSWRRTEHNIDQLCIVIEFLFDQGLCSLQVDPFFE